MHAYDFRVLLSHFRDGYYCKIHSLCIKRHLFFIQVAFDYNIICISGVHHYILTSVQTTLCSLPKVQFPSVTIQMCPFTPFALPEILILRTVLVYEILGCVTWFPIHLQRTKAELRSVYEPSAVTRLPPQDDTAFIKNIDKQGPAPWLSV